MLRPPLRSRLRIGAAALILAISVVGSAAVLAAYRRATDGEILRRLLSHIDQRFRLSYILGSSDAEGDELDDIDGEELDFDGPDNGSEEADEPVPFDLTRSREVLRGSVQVAKGLAARHAQHLREHFNASAEDERVIEEIFEDNLDHLLREDEDYFAAADALMEEIERRFELLTTGELVRNSQGWPRLWQLTTTDRAGFVRLRPEPFDIAGIGLHVAMLRSAPAL